MSQFLRDFFFSFLVNNNNYPSILDSWNKHSFLISTAELPFCSTIFLGTNKNYDHDAFCQLLHPLRRRCPYGRCLGPEQHHNHPGLRCGPDTSAFEWGACQRSGCKCGRALECTDEQLCALKSPVTVTKGPSTYTLSAVFSTQTNGVDAEMTLTQNCHITSSTQGASCSVSLGIEISGDGIATSMNTATATSFASDEIYYRPLTVTAGVDKLNRPQATQTRRMGQLLLWACSKSPYRRGELISICGFDCLIRSQGN